MLRYLGYDASYFYEGMWIINCIDCMWRNKKDFMEEGCERNVTEIFYEVMAIPVHLYGSELGYFLI